MQAFRLEIASYSLQAAICAQASGAHRIELCDNPTEGGTTPSYGVLKLVRKKVHLPVFPIIRPRGGHFVFAEEEVSCMYNDIRLCKEMGFEGVVIGVLTKDAKVDYDISAKLVELAYPLEVTFHRAFDRTADPYKALETIIKAGCTRILTSGQVPDVNNASGFIKTLIQKADNRIIIMPGSGVRAKNIAHLAAETGAFEFHSSAGFWINEPYFSPASMQESISRHNANEVEIKSMINALKSHFKD